MTTKIKRLMLVGLAALLLAGGGLLTLPADEVLAGTNCSNPEGDSPVGGGR